MTERQEEQKEDMEKFPIRSPHQLANLFIENPSVLGPEFLIIDLGCLTDDDMKPDAACPPRESSKLKNLIICIKILGGRPLLYNAANEYEADKAIPLAYLTNDAIFNRLAIKRWHQLQAKERDVYNENFIHGIMGTHISDELEYDLNHHLIGKSFFEPYDANDFIRNRIQWSKLRPVTEVEKNTSRQPPVASTCESKKAANPNPTGTAGAGIQNENRFLSPMPPVASSSQSQRTPNPTGTADIQNEGRISSAMPPVASSSENQKVPNPSGTTGIQNERQISSTILPPVASSSQSQRASNPTKTTTGIQIEKIISLAMPPVASSSETQKVPNPSGTTGIRIENIISLAMPPAASSSENQGVPNASGSDKPTTSSKTKMPRVPSATTTTTVQDLPLMQVDTIDSAESDSGSSKQGHPSHVNKKKKRNRAPSPTSSVDDLDFDIGEDEDVSIVGQFPPPRARGQGPGQGRRPGGGFQSRQAPITAREQKAMIDFITSHNYYDRVSSRTLYREMVEKEIVKDRTAVTLASNFQKIVMKKLDSRAFNLSPDEIKKFEKKRKTKRK